MVVPRIYGNLLNHSYFDLQYTDIEELICYAAGYPTPDVVWIRGFYLLFLLIEFSRIFPQCLIGLLLHKIDHKSL